MIAGAWIAGRQLWALLAAICRAAGATTEDEGDNTEEHEQGREENGQGNGQEEA